MAYLRKIAITTTKQDLFNTLSDTGVYEIHLIDVDTTTVYLTHDSNGISSNSVPFSTNALQGISSETTSYRFMWDSANPLYAFTASGTADLIYMITSAGSTNVNLSVGSCN